MNSEIKSGSLVGSILDQDDDSPINNAVIKASLSNVSDTTGFSGTFKLEKLKVGIDTFVITAYDYDPLNIVLDIEAGSQEHNLFLKKISYLDCIPVEDTNRVYFSPLSHDTMTIFLKAIFARFKQEIKDTTLLLPLIIDFHGN